MAPSVPVARERISKRNDVYVIRIGDFKAGDVSRNDRHRRNDAEISDERRNRQFSFDNLGQVSMLDGFTAFVDPQGTTPKVGL
jgi:hypothetical protein